ncbi:Uncharacterized membrane protein [Halorubrum xinjiangense]|uniref:Uncharacterized membrane protein n=1 Tax=Halorubrum xinjiangense TaxID=261291 RepID=A0A1G7JQ80_9EURY|nr:DUF1616 domain-containing protein [Halorubrum xinjiangense]SDF26954.1 Uncharacterized membrane protein [Halorubrum xinjiangense]
MTPPKRGSRGESAGVVGGWGDLAVAAVLTVAAAAVLLSAAPPPPLRWGFGVPFLLVWPGYAVVSALYPERPSEESTAASGTHFGGRNSGGTYSETASRAAALANPGWTARAALSLASSGVVVALVVIAANRVAAVRTGPVVVGLLLVTLAGLGVAAGRRLLVAPEDRAAPVGAMTGGVATVREGGSGPAGGPSGGPFTRGTGGGSAATKRQTVALVVAAALLVVTVAVAGAVPPQGEGFTEATLLAENESGDLVATDYPTTFVAGEGHPLTVAIENNEHRPVTYEVVVLAQDVDADGSVTAQRQIDEFDVDTDHGERELVERQIAPETTGEGVRLRFLIYTDGADGADGEGSSAANGSDTADAEVDPEDADQVLQLWIDVVDERDE